MALSIRRRMIAASLLGLAVAGGALALAAIVAPPARAQFFDDRYPFFDPRGRRQYMEPQPEERPADYSRAPAPAPRAPDAPAPTTTIMVVGDSTADWLASGLEEALADTPEIAVVRKHKAFSGLIRYESRSELEWPQVARDLLASVKPNIVVVLLGVQDRQAIREKTPPPAKPGEPAAKKPETATDKKPEPDAEQQPSIVAPEPAAKAGPAGTYEFRSEKWEEAYARRVDEMIAALRSTGAAVVWVGLPAIRGTRSTSEASYLNEIYRGRAEKAGIFYVDTWDGFVDEAGRFATQGPDVEGQIRRLRAPDGVHFTKFGARKLAHYVERELRRGLLNRTSAPAIASLPGPDKPEPQTPASPGVPAPRPLAGPVLFLNSPARDQTELLGGAKDKPTSDNVQTQRILVKGEAAASAAGRADDFAWPLRAPSAKADEPLPPTGAPVASLNPAPGAAVIAPPPAARPAVTAQGQPSARVAGQPVLQGQIQPQYGPRGGPPQQGFWRAPPQYSRPPSQGFFGLFR